MESVLAFQGLKSKTSLKPPYATGITGTLMFKKNGTYTVDELINGGGVRVSLYPEYYIHWQMDGLISGELKTGGGL